MERRHASGRCRHGAEDLPSWQALPNSAASHIPRFLRFFRGIRFDHGDVDTDGILAAKDQDLTDMEREPSWRTRVAF